MVNPIERASTAEGVAAYKIEPYVVAADVYAVAPHAGRGGWSWYTGSAGWMYRLILESLLGVSREKDRLRFAPCLPVEWTDLKIRYTYGATVYDIEVQQRRADAVEESVLPSVTRAGVVQSDNSVLLVDDLASHRVVVEARTTRA